MLIFQERESIPLAEKPGSKGSRDSEYIGRRQEQTHYPRFEPKDRTMPATEAQTRANQANAAKSTGPKSLEGSSPPGPTRSSMA